MSFPAKFAGTCIKCHGHIPAGSPINFDPDTRKARHAPKCPAQPMAAPPVSAEPKAPETVRDDQRILGKATYKGKPGYLILWMGTTSRGEAAKLAFRDGGKIFWADMADVQVDKEYHDREYRGRMEPGMTFGRLKRLSAEYAQAKKDGIEPCGKCGGIHRDQGCYMCGCTRCDGAQPGGLCEDD